jgi:hypothetical protein
MSQHTTTKSHTVQTEDQIKNEKLMSLKGEVKDLHPVLETLFGHMPNVRNVENSHGNREHGADFLIERSDEVLDEIDFIGVIVKQGDIRPGDTNVIARQVRECQIPKNFSSGKIKVGLRTIWVVTNGKITGNSKDLIENEFQNLNITFLPQHKLRKIFDKYYPEFWRNIPHEIGLKLDQIKVSVQNLDSQMSLLPADEGDFYVPQTIRRERKIEGRDDPKAWVKASEKIDLIEICKRKKMILIEGGYGYGKSKLLRKMVDDLSDVNSFERHSIIPHYAKFWSFADESNSDPESFLSTRGFDDDLFRGQVRHVIFLDSLDETKNTPEEQADALDQLLKNLSDRSDVCVVVATRPVSATVKGALVAGKSEFLQLSPLSFRQVIRFVEKICSTIEGQNKVIADLKSSDLYRELPRSPISAILLGKVLSQNANDIPSNLTELYSKYLEYAMGRWDQKKGLRTEREYKTLSNILIRLSSYFFENALTEISEDECKDFFKSHVAGRNTELDGEVLFDQCLDRSDILTKNPFDGTISFKHRTYWSNVTYFLYGLKPDCPEMVSELLNQKPKDIAEAWCLVMNYSRYLLAASETEYKYIEPILEKVVSEFVTLYVSSRDGKTPFPKGRLTKIQFLSLVTPLFQGLYGYKFFQNGLESVALRISDLFEDPEERCVAAFFISFARVGFDDPVLVDELVKSDTGHLPPEMQMVVAYEAKQKKCRSIPVKKYLKHISRKLFSNPIESKKFTKNKTPAQIIHEQVIK